MLSDEEELERIKKIEIEFEDSDIYKSLDIVPFSDEDKLRFHKYMKSLAQDLLGDKYNLDEENLIFLLSDDLKPNAAFVHCGRESYIYITAPLLKLLKNKDQLAFILGHELGHFEKYKELGAHRNTKAEEEYSDLSAVSRMIRANLNIEEAYQLSQELFYDRSSSFQTLIDEHMLDANRVSLMGDMVTAQRKELLGKGVDAPGIVGDEVHEIDQDILDLIQKRPHNPSLKDRFFSEEFQNLSCEEKVKYFFKEVEKSFVIRGGKYTIEEPNKTILKDIADMMFENGIIYTINKKKCSRATRFAAGVLDSVFKEEDPVLMNNKTEVFLELFNTVQHTADERETLSLLQPIVKKGFKGFRDAVSPETDLFIAKMKCVEKLVDSDSRHIWFSHLFLDLDNDSSDVGKKFSKDILQHPDLEEYFSNTSGSKLQRLEDGSTIFQTSKGIHVVNEDGVIELFSPDLYSFRTQFIAKQINDTVQILDAIKAGKKVDPNVRLKTLLKAWKICAPDLFVTVPDGRKILHFEHVKEMGLIDLGENNYREFIIEEHLLKYLTPQALSFYREKDKYPQFSESDYTTFIKKEILEEVKFQLYEDEEHRRIIEEFLINYPQSDYRRFGYEGNEYIVHTHAERNEDILLEAYKAYRFIDYAPYKKIDDARLKIYFDTYHTLDGFRPAFGELLSNYDRDIQDSERGIAASYLVFDGKEESDIIFGEKEDPELKYDSAIPYVDYLGSSSQYFDKDFSVAVKEKFKQDVRKVSHWDPDNEDTCVQNFCLALAGFEKQYNPSKKENLSLYQYVALDFYEKASVENKIQLSKALGMTTKTGEDADILKKFKQKCYAVFKRDFENPEISLKDRVRLFAALASENLFDEKYENYFEILTGKDGKGGLLKEIEDTSDDKATLYLTLVASGHRIADPEIRNQLIQKACEHWIKENNQYNDITATQSERASFISCVQDLKRNYVDKMPYDDAHLLLKTIAELSLSQEELSRVIAPEKKSIDTQDKKTIAAAYGFDTFRYLLDERIISPEELQSFFLGEGSWEEVNQHCKNIKQNLRKEIKKRSKDFARAYYREFNGLTLNDFQIMNYIDNLITPQYMMQIKKEFDAAPLPAKGVVMQMITNNNDWKTQFYAVARKLFNEADELGKIGERFLYNYIDSREDSEKSFYLAAIYVAAQNKSTLVEDKNSPYTPEERSLATGIRLFLENSGPAGVKLAQAMASYSGVPDFMRDEMQKAKTQANPPARWEVFDWLEENGQMDLLKHGKLGKLLGSASFFVTFDLEDGSQNGKVVKILRGGSKALADSEFEIYKKTLDKVSSELPGFAPFSRLIDNAASMVDVETNLDIGEKQLHDAQKIYPKQFSIDGEEFNFQVMDWQARGEMWVAMDKAKGKDFKQLKNPYKKAAAKAVFITELSNMFSGNRFDSDRHAGQYKFDEESNTIGIFDTGSISIVEPTAKDKKVLGKVLASTLLALQNDEDVNIGVRLSEEIDKGIKEYYAEELSQGKSIPPYLSEFQRGLLALNDFYSEIPSKELADCFSQALNSGKNKLDYQIYQGFEDGIKSGKTSSLMQRLSMAAQVVNIFSKKDEITPDAKMAQKIGRVVTEMAIETGSGYKALTAVPDKLKQEKLSLEVLDTETGRIQFAKGALKEVISKLKPSNYPPEERREVGAILYKVIQQGTLFKKMNQPFTVSALFNEQLKQTPKVGRYTEVIKKISNLVMGNSPTLDDFKKAVTFGRLIDAEVREGYLQALQKSPRTSFIRKALEKINPINFVPPQSVRKIAKVILKKFAPHCLEIINSFRPQKKTKAVKKGSGKSNS